MAGGGWIKIYRSIQDHWIWDNPIYLKWWLDLLLMANHKPNDVLVNGKVETIDVGERLTSEIKLSERWNVDRKTVRRFLNLLEKEQMISLTKSRQKGTTVKVLKYSDYQQVSDGSKDIKKDNKVYNDRDITRDNGRDINKNDKNEKNDKNIHHDRNGAMKEIFQLYEKIFGVLNSVNVQNLQYWCEDLSPELIIEALKRSKGSRSFKYTEGILKKWEAKGVKNMADVKELDSEFEKSKSGYKNARSTPEEDLPETGLDW